MSIISLVKFMLSMFNSHSSFYKYLTKYFFPFFSERNAGSIRQSHKRSQEAEQLKKKVIPMEDI